MRATMRRVLVLCALAAVEAGGKKKGAPPPPPPPMLSTMTLAWIAYAATLAIGFVVCVLLNPNTEQKHDAQEEEVRANGSRAAQPTTTVSSICPPEDYIS